MNKCLPFCTALDSPWSHFLREKNVKNSLENSRFLLILEISSFHAPMTWPYVQDSVQFTLVAQSCLTLCEAMDCSTPDLPVHHQLLEYTQTHVHWVGDAIHHLIFCCPLLLPPSIFPSIRVFSNDPSHQVAKVLESQLQHQSFQWTPRTDLL